MNEETPAPRKPFLELTPLVEIKKNELQPVQSTDEYETAKGNLDNVIKVGTDALNQMADIAELSQDPRAYRVLNEMIGNMVIASKSIMELKVMDTEVRQAETGTKAPQEVNNTLNVNLTMSEALKLIRNFKKNEEE